MAQVRICLRGRRSADDLAESKLDLAADSPADR